MGKGYKEYNWSTLRGKEVQAVQEIQSMQGVQDGQGGRRSHRHTTGG